MKTSPIPEDTQKEITVNAQDAMIATLGFLGHGHSTRNCTANFGYGKDSKWSFEENLRKKPKDTCLLHYKANPIEYKFNNFGFRSNIDFVPGVEGNVYLGCSHTFGTGHYQENSWPGVLNEKLDGELLNLGIGASGIATGARLLHNLKGIIKPKRIFCHYIHPYRYEYFDYQVKVWRTISPTFNYPQKEGLAPIPKDLKRYLAEEEHMRMHYRANFALIENIANDLGAKLYSVPFVHDDVLGKEYKRKKTDIPWQARDLVHFHKGWHRNVAERFHKAVLDDEPIDRFPPGDLKIENKVVQSDIRKFFPKTLI